MLDTAMHSLLVGARDAIGVWAVLVGLTAVGFALMFAPGWREHVLRARVRADAEQLRRTRLDAQDRCAQELSAAAASAAVTAQRRHSAWVAAHTAAEDAWQAFDAADTAARRAVQAAAFTIGDADRTPAELAERRAVRHRAARNAHRRGELSTRQLADILAGRHGFDPDQDQAEWELRLRLAIRDHLLQTYLQASAAERVAWRDADIAVAAKKSLSTEALAAATDPAQQEPVTVLIPRQRTGAGTGSGRFLHPAIR